MNRTALRLGAAAFSCALLLSTTACSSDGSDAKADDATTTTAAADAGSGDAGTSPETTAGSTDEGGGEAAACTSDSDYLSGTSTVIWTPDGKSEHTADEATQDISVGDGTMDPAEVTVKVGEVFTYTLADDVQGISVVKTGCDGGQTMAPATPAGVYITAPGTYTVLVGLDEVEAGTVTVE